MWLSQILFFESNNGFIDTNMPFSSVTGLSPIKPEVDIFRIWFLIFSSESWCFWVVWYPYCDDLSMFKVLSALWEVNRPLPFFLLIVCCVSYKFQQNIEKWRLEYFGVFFYLQKTLFFDKKRYFSPVSVYFTGLKMLPSGAHGKITSGTGLITGIFATLFSTQNLWSGC